MLDVQFNRPADGRTTPLWVWGAVPTSREWLTGGFGLRVRGVRFRYAGFCTGDAPDERRSGAMCGHHRRIDYHDVSISHLMLPVIDLGYLPLMAYGSWLVDDA